jgi:hypothetical protein
MAEFQPVTMKRKRDGATRKVTTAAEQVAAAFDGFAAPAPSAKKTAAKTAASKNTGGASKTATAGGPVAKKAATAKVAAPAATSTK